MPNVEELLRRQKALGAFGDFVLRHDDMQTLLDESCRLIAEALGTDFAKVLEIDEESRTALVRAGVGWHDGIVGKERISLDERSSEAFAIEHSEPLITNDIRKEERFHFPDFLKQHGVVALVNVPIFLPGGRPWGVLQVDARQVREFEQEDIEFLKTYAMVLGPVVDRLRHIRGSEESEAKFRTLFESIDEGLAVMEVIYDQRGEITDLIFRQVNSAYERQSGISDPVGQSIYDVIPDVEDYWIDAFKKVVISGQPMRVEHYQRDVDMWFDVQFARVDDAGRFVAVVFNNTTARKRVEADLRASEERQAFLLKLSDAVRQLADLADIQGETTRLLRERLNAGWCYYVDWDLDRRIGLVLRDSAREGLPSLIGEHDVSDAPEYLQLLASGEVVTVRDYASYEQLSTRIRQKFSALGFRSMMAAPLVKEGRLIASLIVGDTEIRNWSESEALRLAEVGERTWAAIERARAEGALRESEQRARLLLAELQHRVRNIMAMIRSVARRTGETTDSVEGYVQHLEGRISAMARTQALLTRDVNASVDLQSLILDELEMQAAQPDQYHAVGPNVALPPKAAEVLGLAIHELATNSIKYGAFSMAHGHVDVRWSLVDGPAVPQLSLTWSESGVTIDDGPAHRGFGLDLVTERVPYELHGRGTIEFRRTGIVATMDMPLEPVSSVLQTDDAGYGARL